MRFIRGHNSHGVDRSGPRSTHYVVKDGGYDTPCWIWQLRKTKPNAFGTGGYGQVTVKGRDLLAHRWYYEQAHGPIPPGLQIDHLCKNRDCVNPDHLQAVTPLVNTRRSRSMKLTDEQARDIYALFHARVPRKKIAERFGVSLSLVNFIGKNGPDGPRNPGQRRR